MVRESPPAELPLDNVLRTFNVPTRIMPCCRALDMSSPIHVRGTQDSDGVECCGESTAELVPVACSHPPTVASLFSEFVEFLFLAAKAFALPVCDRTLVF